jgi:hypothetical protein
MMLMDVLDMMFPKTDLECFQDFVQHKDSQTQLGVTTRI